MDFDQSFAISAAGMEYERTRVDVTAANLANATSVLSSSGAGYQPMQVVAAVRARAVNGFGHVVQHQLAGPVAMVVPTGAAPQRTYDPKNASADSAGFVSRPGVDQVTEMTGLMTAVRAYQANVVAMNGAYQMAEKALEIGG